MTATRPAPHAHDKPHGTSGHGQIPAPHDPEHDIDAKATAIWVGVSTLVLFVSLYFMLPLFDEVMTIERTHKIDQRPNLELEEARAKEDQFLRGELSRSKKTIEQVMQEMVKK